MQETATLLWQTGDSELVAALVGTETEIRQAYSRMLDLLSELDSRGVAAKLGYSNTPALLMHTLRISRGDARNRLGQVEDLLTRATPTGSVIEASLPQTAEALAQGRIGSEQVDVIRKTLDGLPDLEPSQRVVAETEMVKRAAQDDPNALARFGSRVRDIVDPDGPPPPDPEPKRPPRQFVRHTRRDGVVEFKGYLDPESGHKLDMLMKPFMKPFTEEDGRGHAERAADAFVEVLQLAANCPDLPVHNGLKTEMAFIVDIDKLRAAADDVVLPGQATLTAAEARRIACDAHVLPAVMGGDSKPLDVGVPSYVTPAHIRRGLVLRDRGCAFPACERPAGVCDSHHIREWLQGGPTQIDNLVLLCQYHHRLIHRSEWTVKLVDGWAYFTPPAYVDPLQQPRFNALHRTKLPATTAA
jgi:hypothetical protein